MKSTVRIDFVQPVNLSGDPFAAPSYGCATVEKVSIVQGGLLFEYAGFQRVVPMHNIRMATYESPTNVEAVKDP